MPKKKLLDDCFVPGKDRLRHAEALAILQQRIVPVTNSEPVALSAATGRTLAQAVVAEQPVPLHTNAAVDGYSFAARDYDREAGSELMLEGRAAAGHGYERAPGAGTALRIFTGAVMPDNHDTVAMQEDVQTRRRSERDVVFIPPGLRPGANVRRAGEDVKQGATVLASGAVLRAQDIAALASLGFSEVKCCERIRVAVLSTGDEVVRPGGTLAMGQVFDANAPMLMSLIASTGAIATDLGVIADRLESVKTHLADAARRFDVIITTGGTSRGEEDHIVPALSALGKRHLWQLAIKPGRPMSFGQIGDTIVLGLPGNPVAVLVCFLLYVWPLLRRLGGAAWPEPRRYHLPALFGFPDRKRGRREFWRGILRETAEGVLGVEKFARDGSGLISGLRAADGLIDLPEEIAEVRPGDPVWFIPFTEFGIVGG